MKANLNALAATLIVAASLVAGAHAEDDKGQFAIKGIGAQTCDTFNTQMRIGSDNAYMFGGWIYGYLTGANRFSAETFDLAPWETLETLSGYLVSFCTQNPQTTFAQAVFNMTSALAANRLQQASNPEQLGADGKQLIVYQEVVRRVQAELKSQNFYSKDIDGVFNEETLNALKEYQTKNELSVTGLPDQPTLHRMFRPDQP
jgi:hypothetical protein